MAKSLEEIELEFKIKMQGSYGEADRHNEPKHREHIKEEREDNYKVNLVMISEILFYSVISLMILCTVIYTLEKMQISIGGYEYTEVMRYMPVFGKIFAVVSHNIGKFMTFFLLTIGVSFLLKIRAVKLPD